MKISNKILIAILTTVIGVLFVTYKEGVVSIAMTVLGASLIVWGVIDFLNKQTVPAVVKGVVGVLIIVFSWLFATIILYVFAGLLLIYSLYQLYLLATAKKKRWELFVQPALLAITAILFFMNNIGWAFTAAGVVLIVQGVLAIIDNFRK